MAQTEVVKGRATKVFKAKDSDGVEWTHVRYHDTDVVVFSKDAIFLNTGGWKTDTTKLRMNQASNQFNLGYQIVQHNFDWYVRYNGTEVPFILSGTSTKHIIVREVS